MHRSMKKLGVRLAPPILTEMICAVWKGREPADWVYTNGTWPADLPIDSGWEHASVTATQVSEWQSVVKRAERPSLMAGGDAIATSQDCIVQSRFLAFGYVLGRTATGTASVSILDWGSGLGQYAVYARALYPELEIDYSCREAQDSPRRAGGWFHGLRSTWRMSLLLPQATIWSWRAVPCSTSTTGRSASPP